MGRLFVIDLEGPVYSCKHCHTHLALRDDLISKSFLCKHGRAYLLDNVVNVTVGEKENRIMMTGWHTDFAYEKSQKYKEGKFIIERFKVLGPDGGGYDMNLDEPMIGSDEEEELKKKISCELIENTWQVVNAWYISTNSPGRKN